jgi:hypothetical protein
MPDILERQKRTFAWAYWIAIGVGFAMVVAYAFSACIFGALC